MDRELKQHLRQVNKTLEEVARYRQAEKIIDFDRQTMSPPKAMRRQGEIGAFLSNRAFLLMKDKQFIGSAEYLFRHREQLGKYDRVLAEALHRQYLRTKRITAKEDHRFSLVYSRAFDAWTDARKQSDFSLFADALREVRDVERRQVALRVDAKPVLYDNLLDNYERGMTSAVLDETFGVCKERLLALLEKIRASKKTIRTDFLDRPVSDAAQRLFSIELLKSMDYDFTRGALAVSEHPFTEELAENDVRVTTHFYPDRFTSSMYSVIHEGGHALFGQGTPSAHYRHFIDGEKTLGMHESVSRFYENRIGRSMAFIRLIYDRAREIFDGVLADVTPEELYEAVNCVQPSLIRTEADELTYTLHIILRYEIEKEILEKKIEIAEIPGRWADKYESYLGVRPANDREGVLQDVHWSGGFGYFPTYALGNMYNAMYYNRLRETHDIDALVENGRLDTINEWMKKNVYEKADRMDAAEWIRDITKRDFTPDDFLDYLEEKYGALYGL